MRSIESIFFFFNDTATTEIYTLSLHDALPILVRGRKPAIVQLRTQAREGWVRLTVDDSGPGIPREIRGRILDRKSTRLNSSHLVISYAVFCLKKKTN